MLFCLLPVLFEGVGNENCCVIKYCQGIVEQVWLYSDLFFVPVMFACDKEAYGLFFLTSHWCLVWEHRPYRPTAMIQAPQLSEQVGLAMHICLLYSLVGNE